MVNDFTKLQTVLKSNGYSLTEPRRQVFIALSDHTTLTMAELCRNLNSMVDRASIYRTVTIFEALGITRRINLGWKYKIELSDAFVHHHHHFSCQNCGSVTTLPDNEQLEHQIKQMVGSSGLKMMEHQLEIRGLCQNCQIKQKSPEVIRDWVEASHFQN